MLFVNGWSCSDAYWLDLVPVEPLYRAYYPDGSQLDVHSDVDAMAAEIERVISPAEAAGYRRYVDFVSKLYRYEMRDFIDTNIDTPLDLVTENLAKLVAIGGFRKLAPKVRQYLHDPRTERLFSFQAMYAGLSPQDALAIYAVIAYMDSVAGVYFPKGGMHALPRAMAAAATKPATAIIRPALCRMRICRSNGCRVKPHGQRDALVSVMDVEHGLIRVTMAALVQAGLISRRTPRVKILGCGSLEVALTVRVDRVSAAAKAADDQADSRALLRRLALLILAVDPSVNLDGAAADKSAADGCSPRAAKPSRMLSMSS